MVSQARRSFLAFCIIPYIAVLLPLHIMHAADTHHASILAPSTQHVDLLKKPENLTLPDGYGFSTSPCIGVSVSSATCLTSKNPNTIFEPSLNIAIRDPPIDEYENDEDPGYYSSSFPASDHSGKGDQEAASAQSGLTTKEGTQSFNIAITDGDGLEREPIEDVVEHSTHSVRSICGETCPDSSVKDGHGGGEEGNLTADYSEAVFLEQFDVFHLPIIQEKGRTTVGDVQDLDLIPGDTVAGRYQVTRKLGESEFSRTSSAVDLKTGRPVCLKVIKSSKSNVDQSLDEIKLMLYVNRHDPHDKHGICQLLDYFYFKEHLVLVLELLESDLDHFIQQHKRMGQPSYFTLPRIQKIAKQVLCSLAFLHSLDLVHSDLKPENVMFVNSTTTTVKVVDLGSAIFVRDSGEYALMPRSYRPPEVVLGLPYDGRADIWSLGAMLAELPAGLEILESRSEVRLLAKIEGLLGQIPEWMVATGQRARKFYKTAGKLFENIGDEEPSSYKILTPKQTSLRFRIPQADDGFLDFLRTLLAVDPHHRPTAEQALHHPWLSYHYPDVEQKEHTWQQF